MHLSRVCALTAAAALLSMTAAMAAATQVNITDPNATTRAAHVEAGNRLAVQEVAPTSYFHAKSIGNSSSSGCVVLATPTSGKALIVRQVRVNVFNIGTTGSGNVVFIYGNADCGSEGLGEIADVNPAAVGLSTNSFDPGLAIPAGGGVSVSISGSPDADIYLDGYSVASSVAPTVGQTFQTHGTSRGQR